MNIPHLMPHQLEAFNGDHFVEQEFLRLRDRFGIDTVVETGTCFGGTTVFLARHFRRVISLEINAAYLEVARGRLGPMAHVHTYLGASEEILGRVLQERAIIGDRTLFYLDAHWGARCPLPEELRSIARRGLRPVIVIHDVQVPGQPGLAFDSYNGQPFSYEWLKPGLDAIYGENGYRHYYNSETESTEIKVGVLYITPGELEPRAPLVGGRGRQKIRLFVNFYHDPSPERQQEIGQCLARNMENGLIDTIFAVGNELPPAPEGEGSCDKLVWVHHAGRPTYAELFDLARLHSGDEDISIFANVDIYFEEYDLSILENYLDADSCFVLSRWDKSPGGGVQLFDRCDSQDCWIFRGALKSFEQCDFTMGRAGCDNAVAQRIQAAGYRLYNPSRDIRAVHVHNTGIRRYDASDRAQAVGPPYALAAPCSLQEVPVSNWITAIAQLPPGDHQSQFGEDAIINHIFRHIGTTNCFFVDLGAGAYGSSCMSNTRALRQAGWSGFGVDMRNKGEAEIIERFITPENILEILAEQSTPQAPDFLNLDIDSCDFWVLQKVLSAYSPRCICTEYNGTLDPALSVVLKYEAGYTWDETNKYGYSFGAGKKLLGAYGYRVIFNMGNQNLFAVREELVSGLVFPLKAARVPYHPENPHAVWEAY